MSDLNVLNRRVVTLTELDKILQATLTMPLSGGQLGAPLMIVGAPGGGKTSIVRQVARRLSMHLETVVLSTKEPTDISGIQRYGKNGLEVEPPAFAKRCNASRNSILFLDEFSCTPPAVQAAALGIPIERRVAELPLVPGCAVIGAMNPVGQAAGGWDLALPSANRWTYVYVREDAEEWAQWLVGPSSGGDGDGRPASMTPDEWSRWCDAYAVARGLGAAFIHRKPQLLSKLPESDIDVGAFPTPRSWEQALRLLASASIHDLPDATTDALIAGAIGVAAGTEFSAFVEDSDVPDLPAILDGQVSWDPNPRKLDQLLSVLSSGAALVTPATAPKRADRARKLWELIVRAADVAADVCYTPGYALVVAGLMGSTESVKALAKMQPLHARAQALRNTK